MELRLIILITKLNIKRVIKASHTKIVIIIGLGQGTWGFGGVGNLQANWRQLQGDRSRNTHHTIVNI